MHQVAGVWPSGAWAAQWAGRLSSPTPLRLAGQSTAVTLPVRWSATPTQAAPDAPPPPTDSSPVAELPSTIHALRCDYPTSLASVPDDSGGKVRLIVPVPLRESTYS